MGTTSEGRLEGSAGGRMQKSFHSGREHLTSRELRDAGGAQGGPGQQAEQSGSAAAQDAHRTPAGPGCTALALGGGPPRSLWAALPVRTQIWQQYGREPRGRRPAAGGRWSIQVGSGGGPDALCGRGDRPRTKLEPLEPGGVATGRETGGSWQEGAWPAEQLGNMAGQAGRCGMEKSPGQMSGSQQAKVDQRWGR